MTGIRLHIHARSPAQVFIDFFVFAGNIAVICTTAIDACLIVGTLGFTIPAMFGRGIEISAFIAAGLKIIFTYDLALAFNAKNSFVASMVTITAVFGIAHNVDAASPA